MTPQQEPALSTAVPAAPSSRSSSKTSRGAGRQQQERALRLQRLASLICWGSGVVETLLVASLLMYGVGLVPRVRPAYQQQQVGAQGGLKQQLLSIVLLLLVLLHLYVKPLDDAGSNDRAPPGAGSSKAGAGKAGSSAKQRPAFDAREQQLGRLRQVVSFVSAAAAAAIAVSLSLPGLSHLAR